MTLKWNLAVDKIENHALVSSQHIESQQKQLLN